MKPAALDLGAVADGQRVAAVLAQAPRRSARRGRLAGPSISSRVAALVDRHVVASRGAGVDLARAGDLLLRVVHVLQPLGDPAGGARDREDHREHLGRDPQRLVDQPRVEVDVRVELALGEVVVVERPLLELGGDLEQRVVAGRLEHLVDVLLDDPRPRVVVLVDAVAEAHQPLLAVLDALEEVGDVVDRLDPAQHPQHRLVGAAVQRAVERGDPGRDRGVGVDVGGADRAHRVGRAVLLVVGVEDEEDVERPGEPRVGLVLRLGHLEQHREEVLRSS